MKLEFEMDKQNPKTRVVLDFVLGQPTETETGFLIPFVIPTPDGKQIPIVAIECTLLGIKNGLHEMAVSSVQYINGELSEPILLNHVQSDLLRVISPTNENEIVLSVASTPPVKTKPA